MIALIRRLLDIQILRNENQQLKAALAIAYQSSNFNCYNRSGGEVYGAALLVQERRRCASGQLVMVCADIAGMGALNQRLGETVVNSKVRSCLRTLASMRGVEFTAQLNSGDEFVFIVDGSDSDGIVQRMRSLFVEAGFSGLYAAGGAIDPSKTYAENADRLMNGVYLSKSA